MVAHAHRQKSPRSASSPGARGGTAGAPSRNFFFVRDWKWSRERDLLPHWQCWKWTRERPGPVGTLTSAEMHQVRLGLGDAGPATNPNIRPLKSLRARRPSQPGLSFERTDAVNCFRGHRAIEQIAAHEESFDGMVSASDAPRSISARCSRVTLQDDYHIAKHTLGWDLPRAISLVVPQAELRKAPPERNPQRLIRSATGRQESVGEAVAELKQRFDQVERILMKRQ